jgi:endogenous inhibitor of DNA gyrase (YacG/DUF329 family)
MKGNQNAKIKCPFCGQKIQVSNYTTHTKSDRCKNTNKDNK